MSAATLSMYGYIDKVQCLGHFKEKKISPELRKYIDGFSEMPIDAYAIDYQFQQLNQMDAPCMVPAGYTTAFDDEWDYNAPRRPFQPTVQIRSR